MNGAEHLNENHGINIGDRLRKLRRQNKISIKKLAADLEMSYSYLSGLENNKHSITIVNLMRILEYFDIDLAYFFGNGDERSKIRFIPKMKCPNMRRKMDLFFVLLLRDTQKTLKFPSLRIRHKLLHCIEFIVIRAVKRNSFPFWRNSLCGS